MTLIEKVIVVIMAGLLVLIIGGAVNYALSDKPSPSERRYLTYVKCVDNPIIYHDFWMLSSTDQIHLIAYRCM